MDRGVAVVLTAVVGGMVAIQGPINSQLGKTIGTFQAAFFSFATGTIILAVIASLAHGGLGAIAEARTLAPQYLIGGLLGACYVANVLVAVRTLGAGFSGFSQPQQVEALRTLERADLPAFAALRDAVYEAGAEDNLSAVAVEVTGPPTP